jgi:hypothetical protein
LQDLSPLSSHLIAHALNFGPHVLKPHRASSWPSRFACGQPLSVARLSRAGATDGIA